VKRVLALGDLHCGARTGLTPPEWWESEHTETGRVQRETWGWFERQVRYLGPFDALLVGGDSLDGTGRKSGGTELLTTDRVEQCRIAAACIRAIPCQGKTVIVHGTPYHTGQDEDWEEVLAEMVGASAVGGHEWVDVNGTTFDLKHKVGSSQVPWGRHTAVARERVQNILWNSIDGAPRADVILRWHVHYFAYCGGPGWLAMTMPALQAPGSKFGVRQCSGIIDYGFITFDVEDNGSYTWTPHILRIQAARPVPVIA
jgi:hypothetical protein